MDFFTTFTLSTASTSTLNTNLHHRLAYLATLFTTILEFMGLIVLVYTAAKCFIGWIKKDKHVNLELAEGLEMALSFKLGGEILRTVVVQTMSEILLVGAITVLRALITLLLQWEIRNEKDLNKITKQSKENKE